MFSFEGSGQGIIVGLGHHALSHPLPELRLRSPKLLPVLADHQGSLFLLFLFLVFGVGGFSHAFFKFQVSISSLVFQALRNSPQHSREIAVART